MILIVKKYSGNNFISCILIFYTFLIIMMMFKIKYIMNSMDFLIHTIFLRNKNIVNKHKRSKGELGDERC